MSVAEIELKDAGAAAEKPTDESPFLSARQNWNAEVAHAFSSARTWQVIAVLCLLFALVPTAGFFWLSSLPRFTPYVVEIDKLGEFVAVRQADLIRDAEPRVVRMQVGNWISLVRTVTADRDLERKSILKAFTMLRGKDPATLKLNEFWDMDKQKDPLARSANGTVSVQISSVLPLSEHSWQCDWLETERSLDGSLKEPPYRMRAILTVYTSPLSQGATQEEIQDNPFGIYVRDFNVSRLP
jgi:type IV secretory pathway TrbF-like protein